MTAEASDASRSLTFNGWHQGFVYSFENSDSWLNVSHGSQNKFKDASPRTGGPASLMLRFARRLLTRPMRGPATSRPMAWIPEAPTEP